ncbi:MAG TPA: hypothetical protein VIK33_11895 [Anaerolineae bacterium]
MICLRCGETACVESHAEGNIVEVAAFCGNCGWFDVDRQPVPDPDPAFQSVFHAKDYEADLTSGHLGEPEDYYSRCSHGFARSCPEGCN